MDESRLGVDQVRALMSLAPTKDERDMLKQCVVGWELLLTR